MARMLAKTRPGHKGTCRYAARGCTCYFYLGEYTRASQKLRRRAARKAEKNRLRRGQDAE